MPENPALDVIIERIVAGARIPGRAKREDLRRELWAHFEDAGTFPEAVEGALRRFGDETAVTESLRQVYRWDYRLMYLAKIAASIIVSSVAALLIQAVVNLRLEVAAEVLRLAPGFSNAAGVSVAVVLALVTAQEVIRAPFDRVRAGTAIAAYLTVCRLMQLVFASSGRAFVSAAILAVLGCLCSKLKLRPARMLLIFGVFAIELYCTHLAMGVVFGPARALMSSAVLVAVWVSTLVIMARLDDAFVQI